MELTIKNYRCFPESSPVNFKVRSGFAAFVGVNNAGKSSLLKFFYEFRPLFQALAGPMSNWQAGLQGNGASSGFLSTFDPLEVFCNANENDLVISVSLDPDERPQQAEAATVPSKVNIKVARGSSRFSIGIENPSINFSQGIGVNETSVFSAPYPTAHRAELAPYIRLFDELAKCLYIGPFRNAINAGTQQKYFDIQTGQAFVAQWQSIKTGNSKRDSEIVYGITNTIKRIFCLQVLDISATADNQTLQIYADEKVYKLQEVGSGLAQFIIALLNAAIAAPPYILIDEPEASLHPSLQLEFLAALASFARKGILFSTHSLGLARSTADWIYSVIREPNGLSSVHPFESTPRLSELAGELSFSGYRELGYKKIILVEGAKDVKTVQQFLRYLKKDHLVVAIPLGGSGLINASAAPQLEEIKRLCTDVSALIDSERTALGNALAPDRQAFTDACAAAGIKCHVLHRRAIENYLTDAAVKKIKGDSFSALGAYERLKDAPRPWSKEENWRIAREMSLQDLNGTDLGAFLASV